MDNLDVLLRELQKKVDTNDFIILSEESNGFKSQITFYPVEVTYDTNGLYIADNNENYFWLTNPDDFNLFLDDIGECLEFAFRNEKEKRYYGITL